MTPYLHDALPSYGEVAAEVEILSTPTSLNNVVIEARVVSMIRGAYSGQRIVIQPQVVTSCDAFPTIGSHGIVVGKIAANSPDALIIDPIRAPSERSRQTTAMLAIGAFAEEPLPPSKTPKILFQHAAQASGFYLCKGPYKRRQASAFRKRYGERVRRLAAAIAAKDGLGWDETEEFLPTCRMAVDAKAAKDDRKRTLNEFEPKLKALAVRYLADHE